MHSQVRLVRDLTRIFNNVAEGKCPYCGRENPVATLRDDPETMAEHIEYGGACQECIDEIVELECVQVDMYVAYGRKTLCPSVIH